MAGYEGMAGMTSVDVGHRIVVNGIVESGVNAPTVMRKIGRCKVDKFDDDKSSASVWANWGEPL